MNDIPIFDSLTHPTIDGNWILPKYPNVASLELLKQQMLEANVNWAFVVGMLGIGSYSQAQYIKMFNDSTDVNLFPIAFYDPIDFNVATIKTELDNIKKLGYKGIKLHPRISNFSHSENIADTLKIANDLGLICLLCTYYYGENSANKITPELTMEMLSKSDGAKVILLHGGAVRLLEYMEIARVFDNTLLDLSFTLVKYAGSSIDMDLAYVFNNFDRRISIGSDFPELTLQNLRKRFESFTQQISEEKAQNIANGNLLKFINK